MIVQTWGYGRLIGCLAIATVLSLAVFGLFSGTVSLSNLGVAFSQAEVQRHIENAGAVGPLAVIALMALAIVASPIPSAPIALAAGAAFGHYLGATYVAIGSELGATIAFVFARKLGRSTVRRFLGKYSEFGLLGSQKALMLSVFASRLLPFVSFDAISYVAGLSQLHLWRFMLATFAGILPASFVLAHFGAVAMSGDWGTAEWITIGLGVVTALPFVFLTLKNRKQIDDE